MKNKKYRGFTLIEALVFLFIFSVTVLTFYRTITAGLSAMLNTKDRLGALAVAQEEMETYRNLSYENVGIQGGIPPGNIEQNIQVSRSGKTYHVNTDVIGVDDPADGTSSTDIDYKIVAVRVYWTPGDINQSVFLVSNFSPPGVESVFSGGILSINVLDSNGNGISNATVHVTNNSVSPAVNYTTQTDSSGNVFRPGALVSDEGYNIEVSKTGYYPVKTYATTSTFQPTDVNASVVSGTINSKSIITDKVSGINLSTKDPLGNSIPNVSFALAGGKKIGDSLASPIGPVYDFNESSLNSGASGEKQLSNMSFGAYFFTFNGPTSNYFFIHMDPSSSAIDQFDVAPGISLDETAVLADKNVNSLLVTVIDNADSTPIAGAEVILENSTLNYRVALSTDKYGQTYFPDASGLLNADQYNLTVNASGYTSYSGSVEINKFVEQTVGL